MGRYTLTLTFQKTQLDFILTRIWKIFFCQNDEQKLAQGKRLHCPIQILKNPIYPEIPPYVMTLYSHGVDWSSYAHYLTSTFQCRAGSIL